MVFFKNLKAPSSRDCKRRSAHQLIALVDGRDDSAPQNRQVMISTIESKILNLKTTVKNLANPKPAQIEAPKNWLLQS